MQKIVSLFARNYDGDRLVRDEIVPGAEWVPAGEGVATVKMDGTCCMVRDDMLYKRYEIKRGGRPPANFEPATEIDPITGKQQGWVPVGDGPEDRWHREAWDQMLNTLPDGTYELIGPKVQGNPYLLAYHTLEEHGDWLIDPPPPRTYAELRTWFVEHAIEGIVWHHPDGRMVKLKRKDFGLPWSVKPETT